MFGEFAIIGNKKRVTEGARKSSKVWRLLQYLVANRNRSVPQEELLEIFCDEQPDGKKQSGALRTLIYRARSALENGGIKNANSIIIAKSGGYTWNSDIECITDVGEFEELIKKASLPGTDKSTKLNLLLKAAELYKGDFLPNSTSDMWVAPLTRWYRTLYLEAVHIALDLLSEEGRSSEVAELCTKALGIDAFDVKLIECHIRTLLQQKKNAEALHFYNRMESMFFDLFGVNFSDDLRRLYSEIKQTEVEAEAELEKLLNAWAQGADFPGAYYVDPGVFKIIYQIEARLRPRSSLPSFIIRFDTRRVPKGNIDGGVMHQLGKAITNCIRMGDIFTRFSPSQYLLMVFNLTYDNCKVLINRILRAIDPKYLADVKESHIKLIKTITAKQV